MILGKLTLMARNDNRRVNFREHSAECNRTIAGNVVNINGVISIEGEDNTFMVMNDRHKEEQASAVVK